MENITELRDELILVFKKLKAKEIGLSEAKELSNASGKIISSCKTQMEYNKYVGSKKPIKFMLGN